MKKRRGRNKLDRIFLSSPHMGGKELDYVHRAFETNWIAPLGENVNMFEKELAEYVGIGSAAALSSGTAAIHLALKAAGVERGDAVFCSSLTFSATANPICYQGATPIFIDSEEKSWNIDPVALEKAFAKFGAPKAVVVVDLYGQSADMDPIRDLCTQYGVPLIEDAAEALGATYHGKQCGTLADFGIYSFNGNKIITTSGGGMLVSDNEEMIKKARFWSTQSREQERHYQHNEVGYNYRMSNVVAGIGRGQLHVLDERVKKKTEIYERYEKAFSDIAEIQMMPKCEYGEPNFWLSCIILDEKSKVKPLEILLTLEKENIESRPIWKPMHLQPVFDGCEFVAADKKDVSSDIFARGLCLPSDTKMTEEDQDRVIDLIRGCFGV
ncbi:MAG: aminotransferase class I/II-fold pyridoxal phosphate-dependent enzyme [Clostridia bacterium]|nr:aminotransferase class I/II-fold pyridoxal phosphate-dependent enzyme [Clostridia bacterium]